MEICFALLFNRKTAAIIFDAYLSAARGDANGLALLSLAYDLALPKMFTWGDFMAKGFSADFDPTRNYLELAAEETIMGSPLSQLFWPDAQQWATPTIPESCRRVQPSDVETLLISGRLDFSTPGEYAAQELLPYLSKGQHLIRTEMGHTGDLWWLQPEAINRLIVKFSETGEVDRLEFRDEPVENRKSCHWSAGARGVGTGLNCLDKISASYEQASG